jgi:hypothetical protein
MKSPEEYSVDDVCVLFVSLELGHLASKIRENVVDGPLLLSLTEADFVNDLGLSGLQTKRVLRGIDLAKQLSASPSNGGGSGDELAEAHHTIHRLEKENKELKDEVPPSSPSRRPSPSRRSSSNSSSTTSRRTSSSTSSSRRRSTPARLSSERPPRARPRVPFWGRWRAPWPVRFVFSDRRFLISLCM